MAEGGAQRIYRAPCPGCGAPVDFRSAQSSFAVCSYCQSTVVRNGDVLSRIGKMAELFDDFSPLQLMTAGQWQGKPFTLIGRLQYGYAQGRWTEWIAAFDEERIGILSEDNGAYVFAEPLTLKLPPPPVLALRVGATTAVNGQSYSVASNEEVTLLSAQGELPRLPMLAMPFRVVELRSDRGTVVSLSYDSEPASAWIGTGVLLDGLELTGLREENATEERGRSFNCPNCGAPITVNLADSKSITCAACHSIIDLNAGIGGELRHAEQAEPVRPLIEGGSIGELQGAKWQVVGFQHRMGHEAGDDEHFGWNEYLLYNRKRGFTFLVDAEDGWSVVKPTVGAPNFNSSRKSATYLGTTYLQQYAYEAETTYVAGEFYWQVERGHRSFNRDFAAGAALLSMEQSKNEVTWSSGRKIDGAAVAKAFNLEGKKEAFNRTDAAPFSAAPSIGVGTMVMIVIVLIVVLMLLSTCSGGSSGGRSAGGSFGGYSSGGGHK